MKPIRVTVAPPPAPPPEPSRRPAATAPKPKRVLATANDAFGLARQRTGSAHRLAERAARRGEPSTPARSEMRARRSARPDPRRAVPGCRIHHADHRSTRDASGSHGRTARHVRADQRRARSSSAAPHPRVRAPAPAARAGAATTPSAADATARARARDATIAAWSGSRCSRSCRGSSAAARPTCASCCARSRAAASSTTACCCRRSRPDGAGGLPSEVATRVPRGADAAEAARGDVAGRPRGPGRCARGSRARTSCTTR